MSTGLRGPILIGALLLSLFAWSACGGSDDDDSNGDNSSDPVATRPPADVSPTEDSDSGEPTADAPDSGSGEASASVTLGGESYEFSGGGGCTEIAVGDGKGLSISLEGFELGIGILEPQTRADSGEEITDAVFNLVADSTPYASTGTNDEITVTVDTDLSGGEFTGTIDSPTTPGSQPETFSGTFTCK